MRLTVVLFVAASLVGTITARGATPPGGAPSQAPAPEFSLFDDALTLAGCDDCGYDEPCHGCDGCDSCGCGQKHHHRGRHGHGGCCESSCGGESCGGCCDSCCGCDSCCCEPWIRLRAEFLPLHRRTSDEFVDFGIGIFNASTEDLDFTFEPGVRVAAEARVGADCSLEVAYLGMHRWTDEALILDGLGNELRSSYTSQLHGGEVNYWVPLKWRCHRIKAAFTFGTKYLDLHEEFNVNVNGGVQDDSETDNHLLATHVGFMLSGELARGFSVRWDGKGGVGANLVSRQTSTGLADFPRQDDSDAAFIGDTNVVLSYQLSCNVSIYAGYYLMWVDGLALAPQQFNVPPTEINHNAFLLFQGGVAGVETVW